MSCRKPGERGCYGESGLANEAPVPLAGSWMRNHLGSSSVLTTQQGAYHERLEYLPYGEVWVEDRADKDSYSTPYKFTGKELDKETGLYYYGARYYDAKISRWVSTDPAFMEGKYFPKPNDYDTEHDFYWYINNVNIKKIPGFGGIYNPINLDVYCYSANNPVRYIDPDGKLILLGCSGKNNQGTQFVNAMMNWASEQGIELDDRSKDELTRVGNNLNMVKMQRNFCLLHQYMQQDWIRYQTEVIWLIK